MSGSYISVNEENVSLSSYSGSYLLIDAFATWCAPCEFQMTHLHDVYSTAKDKVVVLSISMDTETDTIEKVLRFKQKHEANWTFGLDNSSINQTLNVIYYPTTFLIDPNGDILKEWIGITESSEILLEMDQYVELPGSLGRKLDVADTIKPLFSGPGFVIFMLMIWVFLMYSGLKVIQVYFDKKLGRSN